MPEVKITIGKREFEVACQPGEEAFLESAARLLDIEATALLGQFGRMPDSRLLLMAGLMLADKTAGLEEQLARLQQDGSAVLAELDALRAKPAPAPEKVEVPVIPSSVVETMAELTARAEALAQKVDDKLAG
jgi:cell division protein ZapA